ncbi:flavin reductase family protein [Nocardia sp. NPDC058058]|uniref:flavin reductase family protein n=1 Tax=Nocardia sp. NPDC058058 TaxID=3346317 RepID=UPI0036DA61E4
MPGSAEAVNADFDAVVAQSDYPMWVVTTVADGQRSGCLVGFASQASIEPRRFLVCLSKANDTYRVAGGATHVAVHLLTADALAIAELFGTETGPEIDKFEHCEWYEGPHRLPILAAASAWFAGKIMHRSDFGDHEGLLVSPDAAGASRHGAAVLRYGDVANLKPGHPVSKR